MIANRDGGASRRASGLFTPRWFTGPDPATSEQIRAAMGATRDWLLDHQQEDGHWVGELEGDTILESEYVLLMAFLGRHREEVCVKACRYILDQERPEGGWAIYPGGPFDLSATVKAYFALKLVGYPTDDPAMVRNREAILVGGRGPVLQQLHPLLPRPARPDRLRRHAERPARAAASCRGWFFLSLSADVVVDPDDRRPALDHLGAQAGAAAAGPSEGIAELFRDDLPKPSRRTRRLVSWENFFLGARLCLQAGREGRCRGRGGSPASARPIAGCSTTSRTPTASGRSSRR